MEPTAAVASTAGVDLPDEILEDWAYPAMQAGDRDILTPDARAEIRAMVAEIRRHRAEQAAGRGSGSLTREHVERVVREAIYEPGPIHHDPASIARRVADRLAGAGVPVLSAEERHGLKSIRDSALISLHPNIVAATLLLDRLIAGDTQP